MLIVFRSLSPYSKETKTKNNKRGRKSNSFSISLIYACLIIVYKCWTYEIIWPIKWLFSVIASNISKIIHLSIQPKITKLLLSNSELKVKMPNCFILAEIGMYFPLVCGCAVVTSHLIVAILFTIVWHYILKL